jgi:hypothetical protein
MVNGELDDIILSNASMRWRKVALIMALTNHHIRDTPFDVGLEESPRG